MDQPASPAHISCIAGGFFTIKPPGKHGHLIYIIESLSSDPAGLKILEIKEINAKSIKNKWNAFLSNWAYIFNNILNHIWYPAILEKLYILMQIM